MASTNVALPRDAAQVAALLASSEIAVLITQLAETRNERAGQDDHAG